VEINDNIVNNFHEIRPILTRDNTYAERDICYRPSVCPSARLSHGWISHNGWS